jgi:flagellar biosynthesis protein FlhB
MSRMMSSVPSSTVVVTNPTHIAVAIRYDTDKDKAPLVIAKGTDYLANKIKEIAKENNIPIMENKPLARTIYKEVEIGEYIPVELYKAVAEILALVYQLREKNKGRI